MKKAEMKIVRFNDEDVIATSGAPVGAKLFFDFDSKSFNGVNGFNPATNTLGFIEGTSIMGIIKNGVYIDNENQATDPSTGYYKFSKFTSEGKAWDPNVKLNNDTVEVGPAIFFVKQ